MIEGNFPGWTPIVGSDHRRLLDDLAQILEASLPDDVVFLQRGFRCYPSYQLIRARLSGPNGIREAYFLYKPHDPVPLDWTATPIHEINERALVINDAEDAKSYLYFFCFAISGDEGRFFITESIEDLPLLPDAELGDERTAGLNAALKPMRQLPPAEDDEPHQYRFSAGILYGDALFQADFLLDQTGSVEMVDDEPIDADLPVVQDRLGSDRYFVLVRADSPAVEPQEFLDRIHAGERVQGVRVLGNVDARGEVFERPIDVSGVTFNGDVTFDGAKFECPVRFDRCSFQAGLDLREARAQGSFIGHRLRVGENAVTRPGRSAAFRASGIRVGGLFDLRGSSIRGGLDLRSARIEGNALFASVDIESWSKHPWGHPPDALPSVLTLDGADIGGDLDFCSREPELARRPEPADPLDLVIPGFTKACSVVRGTLAASRIRVGGLVWLGGLRCDGHVTFDLARLEGGLATGTAYPAERFICGGSFGLAFSKVRGTVSIDNVHVGGSLRLYGAAIDGSVYSRCTLTSNGHDPRSIITGDFDVSGITADDIELEGAQIGSFRLITGNVGRVRFLPGLEPVVHETNEADERDEADVDRPREEAPILWQLRPCDIGMLVIQNATIRNDITFSVVHQRESPDGDALLAEITHVECGGGIRFWTSRMRLMMTEEPSDDQWLGGAGPDVHQLESRFPGGLTLTGVRTVGELSLVNLKSRGPIKINDCSIGHDLDLGSHGADPTVREGQTTTVCTGLELEATVCEGDADLSGLRAVGIGGAAADVRARRFQVAGKLLFSRPLGPDRNDFDSLSEKPEERVEAKISGRLDLSVGEASHLVISGDSFQEDTRERGISFERGKFRRFQVLYPFPACHDSSDISVERWEIPDRYLLDFLEDSRPFRRSTYLGVEHVLRNDGNDELADVVFRAMRMRVLDEATLETPGASRRPGLRRRASFHLRRSVSRFLGLTIGWGTQSFKPLALGALFVPISWWIFSAPANIIPTTTLLEVTPDLAATDTPTDYGFPWGAGDGGWMTLRFHVPVVPIQVRDRWQPSLGPTHLVLPGGGRQIVINWMSPEDYAFSIYILHWVIWPLFLIGITTRVIRERA